MAKKAGKSNAVGSEPAVQVQRPSNLIDTRVVYCGDNLDQLRKLFAQTAAGIE